MLKKFNFMLYALLFTATSLFAAGPYAYNATAQQRGPVAFSVMDLNGDGQIQAEEHERIRQQHHANRPGQGRQMRLSNSAPVFEYMDTDNSGTVSQGELSRWQEQRLQQRQLRLR